MKISILALISLLTCNQAQATGGDPNGYFTNREWKMDINKTDKLEATSEYFGEPIQEPNFLSAKVICGSDKKEITIIDGLKYCGLDSIKPIGGKLEVLFTDFNPEDPKGYCTKKRTEYFKIPSCGKATSPK